LNSTWNNSAQANANVPPLTQTFPYGQQPIKGISIGGWLILEVSIDSFATNFQPFITPSLFSSYSSSLEIVDEYTLSSYLGQQQAASVLEEQYSTFITRQSFSDMRDAGFDHVRISFPYWVISNVNSNDPYVEKVGWRYLLRAVEYAREFGLRVNLCLHTAPGSQNGFDHRY
jgi:glucan 1,3-beta-glucosidase